MRSRNSRSRVSLSLTDTRYVMRGCVRASWLMISDTMPLAGSVVPISDLALGRISPMLDFLHAQSDLIKDNASALNQSLTAVGQFHASGGSIQ